MRAWRRPPASDARPVIDVTRRSVEETAAAIIRLLHDRQERAGAEAGIDDD
jgi:regulator of PEP synthase PpsR (kinase-PPPase family)